MRNKIFSMSIPVFVSCYFGAGSYYISTLTNNSEYTSKCIGVSVGFLVLALGCICLKKVQIETQAENRYLLINTPSEIDTITDVKYSIHELNINIL